MSDSEGGRASSLKSPALYTHAQFSPSVAERESTFLSASHTPYILCHVVEQRKMRLTAKQGLRSNVDWLTEAIRRFSEAYALGRDFSAVTMSNVSRTEKVGFCISLLTTLSYFSITLYQWKTTETRCADREWDDDEMAEFEDAVLTHGAELRTVRDEVGTRTIYEVVRYYGHWKKCVAVPFLSSVLSDFKLPKTVRNSEKRTAGCVYLACRKHHSPHTACPPLTTRIRKVQSYVRQAKRYHRAVPVERVIPSSGGRRQRACRRPYYAMRAVSHGANMQI